MDFDIVNQNLAAAKLSNVKKQVKGSAERVLKEKELKKACEGFEAIILNTMMKSMRESLPGDALFGESNGSNIYKSMYDQYLSEELSRGRQSIGLKELLYQELKKSL
ncbi:MAG: flagellar biosynthesis protein FlgJ [Desulfobacula sp. RIFOXYB2_FULL_45_6]|nr:MAG: flagellar biosynthesis protein FlgJ [Desulfobacula sp. RIFOXYB2_FULL_45_6]